MQSVFEHRECQAWCMFECGAGLICRARLSRACLRVELCLSGFECGDCLSIENVKRRACLSVERA